MIVIQLKESMQNQAHLTYPCFRWTVTWILMRILHSQTKGRVYLTKEQVQVDRMTRCNQLVDLVRYLMEQLHQTWFKKARIKGQPMRPRNKNDLRKTEPPWSKTDICG